MILDSENQRSILLKMFDVVNFPGEHLEEACEVKRAVKAAQVYGVDTPGQPPQKEAAAAAAEKALPSCARKS